MEWHRCLFDYARKRRMVPNPYVVGKDSSIILAPLETEVYRSNLTCDDCGGIDFLAMVEAGPIGGMAWPQWDMGWRPHAAIHEQGPHLPALPSR